VPKAVQANGYGGVEVLKVVEVDRPVPGTGEVLVQVKAAGINPGEAKIRNGDLAERWPSTFPQGQGSDLAGIVAELGPGVQTASIGDEVIGWVDTRSSQAELVVVPAAHLTPRPAGLSWEAAGSLFVVGATAHAGIAALNLKPGQTVVVSGAAGGVGSLAVQLAKRAGAVVIGIAGASNADWLTQHGVIPVNYLGDALTDRIRQVAPDGVDAFLDTYGGDYVEVALELGLTPDHINTVANFAAIDKYGVKSEGNAAGARAEVLAELAGLIVTGDLDLEIAAVYPLEQVQAAYRELALGHTRGKIVLVL
jgi:NADPH:quinone reductase-like Zn-dependent oxidoreductase